MFAALAVCLFFAIEAAGYCIHRLLHKPWFGALNRAHMTHHLRLYPPQDFLSDGSYRSAGADNTVYRFLVPALVLAGILLWLLPLWAWLVVAFELAALGWANSYVHDATHIRGHWLERFWIYRRWRALHLVHHVDMTKNYGIVTFFADRAVGTYRKPD